MSSSVILLSQEFVDLELFKNVVEDWAIEEKFSTRLDQLLCGEVCCRGLLPVFSSAVHRIRKISSLLMKYPRGVETESSTAERSVWREDSSVD